MRKEYIPIEVAIVSIDLVDLITSSYGASYGDDYVYDDFIIR